MCTHDQPNTCTQSAIAFTAQVITGFLPTLTLIDLWPAAILTAAAMLLIGCMNSDQAVNAIDWTVYITIAFAFGVSAGKRAVTAGLLLGTQAAPAPLVICSLPEGGRRRDDVSGCADTAEY
jgi:di/tricarboxylate transporter